MMVWLRRFLIRHLVSPYGLVVLPSAMFLFGWLFPPELYTHYVREPDYMYLDITTLFFFALCVVAFLLGVRAIKAWGPRIHEGGVPQIKVRIGSPLLYLGVPLAISALLCLVLLALIAREFNIVSLLLSQQGTAVKLAYAGQQSDEGRWAAALFVFVGALWWAGYRVHQLELTGAMRKTFNVVYFAGIVLALVTAVATFDRTNLMPVAVGVALLFLYFRTRNAKVKLAPLLLSVFGSMIAVLILFLGLQLARGAAQFDSVITSLLGYSIVSYNRLAAMLMGILHYPYEGRGGYLVA
jgi:hypothetical protein